MSGSSGSHKTATAPSTPIAQGQHYRRVYRPYFSKRQLALIDQLNGYPSRRSHLVTIHTSNCKFIQQVGKKLGFPQTTISTSQALYHRYCLYNGARDVQSLDVCITALFVGSKMEESIKKLKDIYVVAHAVRYPKNPELDPEKVSEERLARICECERQMLETLSFNFHVSHPYNYIVKFAKLLQKELNTDAKAMAKKAYFLAIDSYRTQLCLEYPSHTIATGCLYLACLLQPDVYQWLETSEFWAQHCLSRWADIEEIAQRILDVYIAKPSEFGPSPPFTKVKIRLNELASQRPQANDNDSKKDADKPWQLHWPISSTDEWMHGHADTVSYLVQNSPPICQ
ncbi:cyclin-like protein [Gongronella butleri]|nr:cyclin-like protein [Gongronella butleri]